METWRPFVVVRYDLWLDKSRPHWSIQLITYEYYLLPTLLYIAILNLHYLYTFHWKMLRNSKGDLCTRKRIVYTEDWRSSLECKTDFSNVVGLVGAILINFTVLTFFFRSTNWITLMIAAKTFARLGIEPGPSGLTELLIIYYFYWSRYILHWCDFKLSVPVW